ncbi:MAG: DUF2332 family protein [Sphingomonadales bacterium]|nr:DUF2332 family protein [Sphingomonadales bacterium]
MSSREALIRDSFLEQAALCEDFGSAFTARLIRALEGVIDRSTDTGREVLDWPGPPEAKGDALALRLCGGLHALVLGGSAPELADIYPPNEIATEAAFRGALNAAITAHDRELRKWLRLPPQTNEVGRSAVLYLGLMEIAAMFGQPMRLFEIGSSAGLNLVLDKYRYKFGDACYGPAESPLELVPDWSGPTPAAVPVTVAERQGCDLSPVNLADAEDRLRLQAYVWPDQAERHRRLSAAIAIAGEARLSIEAMDAGAWVARHVDIDGPAGQTTVLMHSLTYCYLPPDTQAAIKAHMDQLGTKADSNRPLAWLSFELDDRNQPELVLQTWPGGTKRLLARAHPHGRWVESLVDDTVMMSG